MMGLPKQMGTPMVKPKHSENPTLKGRRKDSKKATPMVIQKRSAIYLVIHLVKYLDLQKHLERLMDLCSEKCSD